MINFGKIVQGIEPAIKTIVPQTTETVLSKIPELTEKSIKDFSYAQTAIGKAQIALDKTSAVKKVTTTAENSELPEFLYHFTSKGNYEKILKDKAIKVSNWEAQSANGLAGAYMVDKPNFINSWITKCQELFGPANLAGTLLGWCAKGEDLILLKIPSKSLDKSKLKFRPYIESCKSMIEGDGELAKGLHIDEFSKFKNKMSPLEYVYMGEIPTDSISVESITPFEETTFSNLMNGDNNLVSQFVKQLFKE